VGPVHFPAGVEGLTRSKKIWAKKGNHDMIGADGSIVKKGQRRHACNCGKDFVAPTKLRKYLNWKKNANANHFPVPWTHNGIAWAPGSQKKPSGPGSRKPNKHKPEPEQNQAEETDSLSGSDASDASNLSDETTGDDGEGGDYTENGDQVKSSASGQGGEKKP
jgi:hypothetical protein